MKIYNSLSKKVEDFSPINPPNVGLYTCGMTVYDYAHIGHGRKYVMDDLLRRVLTFNGFMVKHVQNVTDVGHLASDSDSGEDKMEKGAIKAKKTVWEVAEYFMNNFYETMDALNILRPNVICRATDHIPEQIELIKKLFENGHAYDTPEAVYFDIETFKNYGQMFGQSLNEKMQGARDEVQTGSHKKHSADFALWFKRVGRFENHTMHWESPWGDGFPGWHIECSAMSMKYLGDQFDIHTGGEDHLPIHHPNEIAQSEGASNKQPFVRYWVHYSHLMVDGRKMSKSLGNFVTLKDVTDKNIDPIALRYFYLTAHYKKHMNFTWEALNAASITLSKLREAFLSTNGDETEKRSELSNEKMEKVTHFQIAFKDAINDDLNFPASLAVVWEVVKSNIPSHDKRDLLLTFDEVLGLNLSKSKKREMPREIYELLEQRNKLRHEKKFEEADKIRDEIEEKGYTVSDESSS